MATSPRGQVIIDGDVGPLRQKLREATAAMNSFGRDSGGAMQDAMGPAAALQARIAGIATVISSGALAVFVKGNIDAADALSKSSQKAGVTTEQFSGMAYAARLADVDTEALTKTYAKLNGLIADGQAGQKEAVETFRRLKIDPKNLQDADQLLMQLAERFASMDDGVLKTGLAIDVFGEKLGPKLIPFLNGGADGLQALRDEAASLGVVLDTRTGKAAEEFNDTLTRIHTATQGMGMTLAKALLPALQAVASAFLDMHRNGSMADTVGTILRTTFEALAVLGANVAYVFGAVGREIGAWAAQIANLARGDLAGFRAISDAVKADGARARAELDQFERRVMQLGEFSPAARAREDRGFNPIGPSFSPEAKKPSAAPDPKSMMATYELRLAEEKRISAILDQGAEYGKERELAYWQSVLSTTTLGAADRVAILRKAAALEVEIASKAAKDRTALESEMLAQAESLALGKIDGERAASQAALELGQITHAQQLALEVQYEEQRYQIQLSALQRRQQMLADDPSTSEVERQRVNGRLLQLEQQHQQKLLQLQTNVAKQGIGAQMFDEIGSAFGNALNGMLTRAQTWYGALSNIFSSLGSIFLTELVTKPVAQYVAAQARMLAAKLGFVSAEAGAQATASGTTVALKAAETTAVVGANAAQAGSGAAAAVAPTPFVGPMLALAAMAAIFAAVSALKPSRSAAGGFDIPRGLSPVTQLHPEEMVLPAHLANPLRALLGGGGAGGGGDAQVSMYITTPDADSFRRSARQLEREQSIALARARGR